MPDGNGTKASVAGPAKRAEVAVLHADSELSAHNPDVAFITSRSDLLPITIPTSIPLIDMDTPP